MSETNLLGTQVEDMIRNELGRQFQVEFRKVALPIRSGGQFRFDAVSADGRIVVSIKSNRGTTRGGKPNTGGVKAAITDLYFLSLVEADRRILVVTNPGFFERLSHDLQGRIAPGLELRLIELPTGMNRNVQMVLDRASREQRSRED